MWKAILSNSKINYKSGEPVWLEVFLIDGVEVELLSRCGK